MLIMDVSFHCVAVDIIGPFTPVSDIGNWYILTVVNCATKYPEAVAKPRIETESSCSFAWCIPKGWLSS